MVYEGSSIGYEVLWWEGSDVYAIYGDSEIWWCILDRIKVYIGITIVDWYGGLGRLYSLCIYGLYSLLISIVEGYGRLDNVYWEDGQNIFDKNENTIYHSYDNLLQRGIRIGMRSKVNDSLVTGLRIVDLMLAVGRGQRQLILGDRYTGKTTLYMSMVMSSLGMNQLSSINGIGTKRLFSIYIGLNISLNKLSKFISYLYNNCNWYLFILSTHSSSSSLMSFIIPLIGITISERIRDRGFDCCICFDDLSKHSKSYRQISLLQNKIPSRDAYPSDIFNIHSSLLERVSYSVRLGTLRNGRSTISCMPIIETINSDISEYIATNVISITDGQFYFNKHLFNNSIRPAIDSSLSVTRIGSNAQCKLIKHSIVGIKNTITTLRNEMNLSINNKIILDTLNNILYQDYLYVSLLETSLLLILIYSNSIFLTTSYEINRILLFVSIDCIYLLYILFITKSTYNLYLYLFITFFINYISYICI